MSGLYQGSTSDLLDKSPCAGVRADLKICLLESDCVRRDKKTPRDCLKTHDGSVPDQCYALRNTFFDCKSDQSSWIQMSQVRSLDALRFFFMKQWIWNKVTSDSRGQLRSYLNKEVAALV
uniref:Cytochrome c oxidase assembly factor 5 n=1 Tax=Timema genevievae TaxID=629358 RepID=A0A7R9JYN1_TIMGE|nr:unnamed protein product [Timema genevievae]